MVSESFVRRSLQTSIEQQEQEQQQQHTAGETFDARGSSGSATTTRDHVHSSSILYQDAAHTVALVDIPASITLAQRLRVVGGPDTPVLLSCEALQRPYPSTEPKSEAARARVDERLKKGSPAGDDDDDDDAVYRALIRDGLAQIRAQHAGPWHLPRRLSPLAATPQQQQQQRRTRKRRASSSATPLADNDNDDDNDDGKEKEPSLAFTPTTLFDAPITLAAPPHANTSLSLISVSSRRVHNPHRAAAATLQVKSLPSLSLPPTVAPAVYRVPPRSTLLLATLDADTTSPAALHALLQPALPNPTATAAPGQFDLVLLDPPWPNRSVIRSGAYATSRSYHSSSSSTSSGGPLFGLGESLGAHLAPAGVVACWITHSAASRRVALEAFRTGGVALREEWVWAKVTAGGELVGPLDGVWRRPWEVLLLGRRVEEEGEKEEDEGKEERKEEDDSDNDERKTKIANRETVRRKLLVAVPDLHSRKPCLKELLVQEGWIPSPQTGPPLSHQNGSEKEKRKGKGIQEVEERRKEEEKEEEAKDDTVEGNENEKEEEYDYDYDYDDDNEARVLEVFARHMTAGWWAWGDEALRFNWEGHWSAKE